MKSYAKTTFFLTFFWHSMIMKAMEGYTMKELATLLGINEKTVNMRIFRQGIKPLTKDAIYDKSVLEAIRNVPGKGRPRKPDTEKSGET